MKQGSFKRNVIKSSKKAEWQFNERDECHLTNNWGKLGSGLKNAGAMRGCMLEIQNSFSTKVSVLTLEMQRKVGMLYLQKYLLLKVLPCTGLLVNF